MSVERRSGAASGAASAFPLPQEGGGSGLVIVETKTLVGGDTVEVVGTTNTTYPLTAVNPTAYWWVAYDPNDTAFTGRQSDCHENTAVAFTNDGGPGTLFPSP